MIPDIDKLNKQQLLEKIILLEKQVSDTAIISDQLNKDKILHELQVNQLEVELQNRELVETQLQLEITRDEYADLYDFAPVNYFTFDDKGIIKNINSCSS